MIRRFLLVSGVLLIAIFLIAFLALMAVMDDPAPLDAPGVFQASPQQIEHGKYLVQIGNCMSCHTPQGGVPFAGGKAIGTPFGTVYSSNLTPDKATGLGGWSAAEFWRAMHHGRSKDGRLLYPAFPYTSYTHVSREDSDAIWAYLQTLAPVVQAPQRHALRFPYSTQAALAVWRALYFQPGSVATPNTVYASPEQQRGAYLVNGVGHCAECHSPRNALGASVRGMSLSGGLMPAQNWYAPALNNPQEAGLSHWSVQDAVALLQTGVAPQASVLGPMAEVVFGGTQFLSDADARAMVVYLQSLPAVAEPSPAAANSLELQVLLAPGGVLYRQQCAACHGEQGQGQNGFPALAGNRAVVLRNPGNVIRLILQGGYLPATASNPQPLGMPPFLHVLNDQDIAAVSTYIRNQWGNSAPAVSTMDVYRVRERRSF
jgi:mono/diheme cytochrome c family protein